jgi:hypothetical protein
MKSFTNDHLQKQCVIMKRKREPTPSSSPKRKKTKVEIPSRFKFVRQVIHDDDKDDADYLRDRLGLDSYVVVDTEYHNRLHDQMMSHTILPNDLVSIVLQYIGGISATYQVVDFYTKSLYPYVSVRDHNKIREYISKHDTIEDLGGYMLRVHRVPEGFNHLFKTGSIRHYPKLDPVAIANEYKKVSDDQLQDLHRTISCLYYCLENSDRHNWCRRRITKLKRMATIAAKSSESP